MEFHRRWYAAFQFITRHIGVTAHEHYLYSIVDCSYRATGLNAVTYVGVSRTSWTGVGSELWWSGTYPTSATATVTGDVIGAASSFVAIDTPFVSGVTFDSNGDPTYSLPVPPNTAIPISGKSARGRPKTFAEISTRKAPWMAFLLLRN